jgi:hypothetical protein
MPSSLNLSNAILEHKKIVGQEDEYDFSLVVPSGKRYALGCTIKDAIYGKVVHASREYEGCHQRDEEHEEVAIKIYCKGKLEATICVDMHIHYNESFCREITRLCF